MKVRVGSKSDVGRARERNEDSLLVRAPLFAVADGMGGHRGGNVASAMALESLEGIGSGARAEELIEKVRQANRRVMQRGNAERELRGMGTTLTAILAEGDHGHLVHIGDSRAYLLRDGHLQQLTTDHTLVQGLVDEGRLTLEEAAHHPQRSIVTRALGVDRDAEPDPLSLDLLPGDRILLCTDGLTTMLDPDQIQEVLEAESDPQAASERLVREANEAGGDDNVTVIILDFDEGDGADPGETEAPGEPAITRAPATPTSGPDAGPTPPAQPRRPRLLERANWRRVAVWTALVAVLLVMAVIGARTYVNRQWYVGNAGGQVAVYNGIPTKVLGISLSHTEETTNLSSADAERLAPWRNLDDGITAGSLAEARSIVEQIRHDLSQTTEAQG